MKYLLIAYIAGEIMAIFPSQFNSMADCETEMAKQQVLLEEAIKADPGYKDVTMACKEDKKVP